MRSKTIEQSRRRNRDLVDFRYIHVGADQVRSGRSRIGEGTTSSQVDRIGETAVTYLRTAVHVETKKTNTHQSPRPREGSWLGERCERFLASSVQLGLGTNRNKN